MPNIAEALALILEKIRLAEKRAGRPEGRVSLIAVSKKKSVAAIIEAIGAGQLVFGENYLQEAAEKIAVIGGRARWHFIGHLQGNKAKQAAELFDMIETIDRLSLAAKVNNHLAARGKNMDILVQVNIGHDPQKAGVMPDDAGELLTALRDLPRLRVRGLMTMPPLAADPEQARPFFCALRELARDLEKRGLLGPDPEMSMGMSQDFEVAIEEGATMVRIGSALFGAR